MSMDAGSWMCGVLLAAGAGTRAGGPKALRHDPDGTSWLLRSIDVLLEGGCREVAVVLGCSSERARHILRDAGYLDMRAVRMVEAADWESGMSASLRAGMAAVPADAGCALVHLVDLPDVGAEVVRRVALGAHRGALARAAYAGRPGHPVLFGADHLQGMLDHLTGDAGAKNYLANHHAHHIECGDLATGNDQDT